MGNQARRRQQLERARRRRRAAAVAALLVVAAALVLGWIALSGDDEDEGEWTLAGARVEVVRPGDPGAEGFEGRGYRVVFDARWEGETADPPRQALECTLEVRDRAGRLLHEREFGLFVGGGETRTTWNPTPIEDEELARLPETAEISCAEAPEGAYVITGAEVVRGFRVAYEAVWRGEGEPRVQSCEVWLVRDDDPEEPVFEEPVAMSPRLDGEQQQLLAFADELTLPPDDAVLECDLDEGEDDVEE